MKYYLSMLCALLVCSASAQKIAVKSNLLYDATASINLGVEIGLGKRTTLDLSGDYNAWYTNKDANEKIRHGLVQPEFRYYFCEKFNGHFVGLHGVMLAYNICGDNWLLNPIRDCSTLRNEYIPNSRYQGVGYGAGVAYGYDWMLSNRWNVEFTIGAGYLYLDYDRYGAPRCAPLLDSGDSNYWGITKLGISLVYLIK